MSDKTFLIKQIHDIIDVHIFLIEEKMNTEKMNEDTKYKYIKLIDKLEKLKKLVFVHWDDYMKNREITKKVVIGYLEYIFELATSHLRANIYIYKTTGNPIYVRMEKAYNLYRTWFNSIKNDVWHKLVIENESN